MRWLWCLFLAACGGFQTVGAGGPPARVRLGETRSCGLWSADDVRCWGEPPAGSDARADAPFTIPELHGVEDLALSIGYDCALLTDGTVSCWGAAPATWSGLIEVRHLAGGSNRACAVEEDGILRCGATFAPPVAVAGLGEVTRSALGERFSCARSSDGAVSCWGKNELGELGDGSGVDQEQPVKVALPEPVDQIGVGDFFACARGLSGSVYCWGGNAEGELGSGSDARYSLTPVRVPFDDVKQIGVGASFACARTSDGVVDCWGDNAYGQLGDGTGQEQRTPVQVTGLPPADDLQVAWGGEHACALGAGALYCWGDNGYGQLGASSETVRLQPAAVRF